MYKMVSISKEEVDVRERLSKSLIAFLNEQVEICMFQKIGFHIYILRNNKDCVLPNANTMKPNNVYPKQCAIRYRKQKRRFQNMLPSRHHH